MVSIENADIIDNLSEKTHIRPVSNLPTQIGNMLVPVISAEPFKNVRVLADYTRSSTTAGATIMSLSDTKDTFITGMTISLTADGTADSTSAIVTATMPNETGTKSLFRILKQSAVAISIQRDIIFNMPIKLKRGSAIPFSSTFTVGAQTFACSIYGYELDTAKE